MHQRLVVHCALLVLLVSTLQACRVSTLSKSPGRINKLHIQPLDFTYLAISSYLDYQNGQQHYKLRVRFHIHKDKLIWFSATTPWGAEVARGMVTPQGVRLIDRVQRTYQEYDYATLQTQWQCPCSYALLQAILLGDPPFAYTPQTILQSVDRHAIIQQQQGLWSITTTINRATGKVEKLAIIDRLTQDQCTVHYQGLKQYQRGILFREAQLYLGPVVITLRHMRVHRSLKPLCFPFTVPPQYAKQ